MHFSSRRWQLSKRGKEEEGEERQGEGETQLARSPALSLAAKGMTLLSKPGPAAVASSLEFTLLPRMEKYFSDSAVYGNVKEYRKNDVRKCKAAESQSAFVFAYYMCTAGRRLFIFK